MDVVKIIPHYFFFERRIGPKDREASYHFVGGDTIYIKDPREVEKYKQVLTFCTKDPKSKLKKAIGSSSFSTASMLFSTANHAIAGDFTTWDGAAGAHYAEAEGPPCWHRSLEVEDVHLPPAGRSHQCRR
jgi:hypothetical protein